MFKVILPYWLEMLLISFAMLTTLGGPNFVTMFYFVLLLLLTALANNYEDLPLKIKTKAVLVGMVSLPLGFIKIIAAVILHGQINQFSEKELELMSSFGIVLRDSRGNIGFFQTMAVDMIQFACCLFLYIIYKRIKKREVPTMNAIFGQFVNWLAAAFFISMALDGMIVLTLF